MRKQLCVIAFVLLMFSALAVSVSAAIVLMTPSDGAAIATSTADFIFSFDTEPNVLNCSLVIDGAVAKTMNTLIKLSNNKITLAVADGSHTWKLQCYDRELSMLVSESRSFTVDAGQAIKEGYTIFYYSTGRRSYILTIAPGQKEVTLPETQGGDDINIKLNGKSYYLDVLNMGNNLNTTFVKIRDRNSGKINDTLKGGYMNYDFNNDGVIEVQLYLKDVIRGINALFVATPYPGTAAPSTPTTPETPVTPPVTKPVEKPVEQGTGTTTPTEQPAKEETGGETPSTQPETEEAETGETSLLPVILPAIVVLIIIIIIILVVMNKRKGFEKESPRKKEAKTPKKETKKELPPEAADEEEAAPIDEKFDIIKSTGGRVRK